MSTSKTSKHRVCWPIEPAPGEKKADPEKDRLAGSISHDERGNAVYKKRSGDSTSTMLKRLEVPGLSMEGQENAPAAAAPAAAPDKTATPPPRVDAGGGYNPYDQGKVVKKPSTPKAPVGKRSR